MPLSAQTQLNEDLLRAFDAFQSSHARLLDDFLLVQPSSKGNSRSPMGLLLLRQKLAVKHYQSIGDFWIDITTIFDRFSSEANHNSIRMSMANALHVSLRRHCCVPLFGNRPKQRTELQQALEAVGQLEALFMAYNKSAESLRQVQQSIKPAVDQLHQEHQARQQAAPAVVASTSIDISSALIASRIRTAIIPNEDVDMHQAPALPSLPSIQPPASVVCTPTGDSPPPPSHQKVFSQAPQVRRAVAAITPRASIPAKASSHPSGVKEKQQPGLAVDATAALTSRAEELERRNSKLVQMVVDLQAQLAAQAQNVTDLQNERDAAMSALAERLICVKQEKLDAQADAVGAGLKAAEAQQLLQVADAVAASARADKKRAKAQLKHGRQMLEREQEKIDDARHAASAIMSQRAEQLKTAEQERLEAQAEARKAAAQAAQAQEGKRKATTELEHEEKRRRSAEKQLKELSIRHRQLQAALLVNPSARSDCALCFSNPTSAVCLPCGHLVSCIACAKEWQQREGKCAICHKRVEQVVQTFLAADNSE
jgi:hypothetical protein